MNAQQLKNAILQEAIEGRLVPQDPNDEPASVLLDRIRNEKAQLVKEGKLKKKDLEETPIAEEEKPFAIPESWEWVRLGEYTSKITDFVASGSFASLRENVKYYSNVEYAILVRTKDFQSKFQTDLVYTDKHGYEFLSNSNLFGGELILPNIGASIGKVFIVPTLNHRMTLAPNTIMVKFYKGEHRDWIFTLFNSGFGKKLLCDISSSTAQGKFNKTDLKKVAIPIPPLAEQHRIVARIEELLPKVEEYGKAQEALDKLNAKLPERLKKSILQEAIEGRLVPQDPNDEPASVLLDRIREEKKRLVKEGKLKKKDLKETPISEDDIPFDIPDSWEWVRISDVVNVLMGQSPDGNDVFEAKEGDKAYEFHQGKICFTEKYITPSGKWCKFPSRIANKDSLLICVRAPIGDVNITQRSIGIGRGLAAMEGMGNISNMFLFYWMLAHKRCLEDQGTGSTFKAITVEVLKNQKIPLPPLAEQKRIVAKIEEAFKAIDALS